MLSIKGLCKTYPGGVRALDSVTLDIPKGMFGLLGPNGAGKSTLMRTIATLQGADSGSIHFDGIDVLGDTMALRRRLGYLPQEFGAYPRTSPEVMLGHFAALKGIHGAEREAVVRDMLVRTNLWELRTRNIDTLSGGMRQRFGIAQALIGNPSLLVVDEPTAGLDPAERRRFQNLLAAVGEDVVVILSTHIVEDVSALCPYVAIMALGRILRVGEPPSLTAALDGRLWSAAVDKTQAARLRASGVPIEIYYDPKHARALPTIMKTVKHGMDYYVREFGPYIFGSFRIFEYPRYSRVVDARFGVVAFNEGAGFFSAFRDRHVDFVTAHELGHLWWGGQVRSPVLQGMLVLNETLSSYSALMLREHVEGRAAVREPVAGLGRQYLDVRSRQRIEELPIVRSETAIAGTKGVHAMYACATCSVPIA